MGIVMPTMSDSWNASVPMTPLRHLAGDDDERDAVHVGRGDAGHRVRGARAGRDDDDAGLAGSARIAVGLMSCALLVAGEHMVDLLRIVQGIVDLDGLPPGYPKTVSTPSASRLAITAWAPVSTLPSFAVLLP
jgi:hypothetical protein